MRNASWTRRSPRCRHGDADHEERDHQERAGERHRDVEMPSPPPRCRDRSKAREETTRRARPATVPAGGSPRVRRQTSPQCARRDRRAPTAPPAQTLECLAQTHRVAGHHEQHDERRERRQAAPARPTTSGEEDRGVGRPIRARTQKRKEASRTRTVSDVEQPLEDDGGERAGRASSVHAARGNTVE